MRGYLHGDGIILRNIKSANILLDAQVKAEASDFTLARHVGGACAARELVLRQMILTQHRRRLRVHSTITYHRRRDGYHHIRPRSCR